jgi:hypothetical protein
MHLLLMKYRKCFFQTNQLDPPRQKMGSRTYYGHDPEEASPKNVAATETRSKAKQQKSFVFSENATTAAGYGEVAFVSSNDVEVSGFRSETVIASDLMKCFPSTVCGCKESCFREVFFPIALKR